MNYICVCVCVYIYIYIYIILFSSVSDVGIWLKSLRLHKYSPLLCNLTYEELLALDESALESQGVTKGARHKIVLSISKLKERHKQLVQIEKVRQHFIFHWDWDSFFFLWFSCYCLNGLFTWSCILFSGGPEMCHYYSSMCTVLLMFFFFFFLFFCMYSHSSLSYEDNFSTAFVAKVVISISLTLFAIDDIKNNHAVISTSGS